MIRKNIVFIILILITVSLTAQIKISKDTILSRDCLVRINELAFSNDKEKEYYFKYVNSRDINDAFHLLFYVRNGNSNVDSILKKLDEHVDILRVKMMKYPEKKKMKFLYSYIHNTFFDKYVELALFPDIFGSKEYNCLSASILYGFFLEKLQIPYEARMSSNHVYLISYPGTMNIVLETTNPISKIALINDDFKREYITMMREVKLIGSQEMEKFTVNELFGKYYFEEDVADMYDMVGTHYLNQTATYINKFAYQEAYRLILKAHVINPDYKTIFTIIQIGAKILNQDGFKKSEDAEILGLLSRFTDYGITVDMIVSDFNTITQTQLINNSDTTMYQNSYNSLMYYATDSALKANLSYTYYKALCLYWYQSSKLDKALNYIDKAFLINPNNKESEQILVEVFSNYIYANKNNTSDFKNIYDKIDSYLQVKPELADNKTFGLFRMYYWVDLIENEYSKGNMVEGDKYLDHLERILTIELISKLSYDIQNLYIKGSFYYYKRYNNKKAKEYIVRGLKYLPDSYELKRRLNAL